MNWVAACSPDNVKRIACVGAGTMGAGWAARFIALGYTVTLWDPAPDAAETALQLIDIAWPALVELGLSESANRENVAFANSLEEAVVDADFVQESALERLALKQQLLADIDRHSRVGVVIASSTSGLLMSDMAAQTKHPERLLVGHPYNPPYLIPLVEVAAGKNTAPAAVRWAEQFYRLAQMKPLVLAQELPGFIANRLQSALWTEVVNLLTSGAATVEQIDASMTEGPGLRWALLGPCMIGHLAGGQGGMEHTLEHLWSPEAVTEELRQILVEGCKREAAGRSINELTKERDAALVAILKLRKQFQLTRPDR